MVLAVSVMSVTMAAPPPSPPSASQASQVQSTVNAASAVAAGSADQLDALDRWRKMISDDRALLERQADRQYGGLEKLFDKALWVLGVLISVAFGFLFWFFGKSKNEAKAVVKEMFEERVREAVDAEAQRLREQYQALRTEVDDLASFKSRRVVWVAGAGALAADDKLQASIDRALSVMRGAGISNISQISPAQGDAFQVGDPDLVVLSFDGSEEARALLTSLVHQLQPKAPPVPLLIYSFVPGTLPAKLDEADIASLESFDWYVPVNFPAQLVAQVQVLLRRGRSRIGEL
ncbi:hypothetical protein [Roseateles saccharophilus]|uniref:Uncharacterized protein n=1 Tax=Roseateles saccharophilus TaxID=304 RepID=A0A4R3UC36_ROSSA|nr:hypothetical protein [Roseateles saccharophilus]MDG0835748.1 hypothetical protein [Roseateles saccharophilus]TCU84666.1 hypothetical protein EV671_105219 [Roseateles saccharophilus]